MKKFIGFMVLAFWVAGGLLFTPGVSFAQVAPGIHIFDDDASGITYTLFGSSFNSNLVVTPETSTSRGSLIWDFDYSTGLPPATYSYNIYEPGTNLQNPPASALSDTLQFTRSGGGPVGAHGHLEFYSGPLNENFLLTPLSNATAINETGFLQTPPNGPLDLVAFQFQSDLDTTSVPEPISLLLFGAGLVGMAVIGRKDSKEEA
jgi:hypothetical protein